MSVDRDSRARTHLANERTFLAWFRTGITLVALGLASAQFLGGGLADQGVVLLLAALVVAAGAGMVIAGGSRYRSSREHIDVGDFEPAGTSIVVSGCLGVVIAIVAVAFVWLVVAVR